MKHVTIVQNTQSEWLGLLEDHLEGRGVRFGYIRPFTGDSNLPNIGVVGDGLILLGGGPWGTVSEPLLPVLDAEIRLARACLMLEKPVIGMGLGAQILAIAADGKSVPAPLTCRVSTVRRTQDDALNGFLPEEMPMVEYGRDRAVPPDYAQVLAVDEDDNPSIFQIGENSLGFAGHPGVKLAMIEDLVMEFEDAPENITPSLDQVRRVSTSIEDALVPVMTGVMQLTKWMHE